VPILLQALGRLVNRPEVLVCDGYGIAHPRRFGLACHISDGLAILWCGEESVHRHLCRAGIAEGQMVAAGRRPRGPRPCGANADRHKAGIRIRGPSH
jgi:hypothetical protein